MSNETDLAAQWLVEQLSADGPLGTYAPGGIWEGVAPASAAYPFVSFTFIGGSDPRVLGDIRMWSNQLWNVKAVALLGEHETLSDAANRIDFVLDRGRGEVQTAFVYECRREGPFRRDLIEEGKRYRELGGMYRLWIQDPVAA